LAFVRRQLKVTSKARATATKKEDTSSGGLQIGDIIPDTTLQNEKEEDVDVKQLAEDGLVIFVVPKADTRKQNPHCLDSVEPIDIPTLHQLAVPTKPVHFGMHTQNSQRKGMLCFA